MKQVSTAHLSRPVESVTALSRNGVSDWLIQRVTALILAAYTVFLGIWLLSSPPLTYHTWQALFESTGVQVATLVGLVATCAHAWVGVWTCGSDYLSNHLLGRHAVILRLGYQATSILILILYLLWGINILWGN